MNRYFKRFSLIIALIFAFCLSANAQYYYGAGAHVRNMISPALSGSFSYKGYVEGSYLRGLGDDRFDVAEISTTQGFTYSSWLFMGAGLGIDLMIPSLDFERKGEYSVMVPIYADFRFNIGNQSRVGLSIDLRLGTAINFNDDFYTNNGYLLEDECWYIRPSISMRIPINKSKPRQALNIGFTYQFIMTDAYYCHSWYDDRVFNNIGATIGFEW